MLQLLIGIGNQFILRALVELRLSICCLFTDTYDVLALSGSMGEGHIQCKGLAEMVRIVKPGKISNASILFISVFEWVEGEGEFWVSSDCATG